MQIITISDRKCIPLIANVIQTKTIPRVLNYLVNSQLKKQNNLQREILIFKVYFKINDGKLSLHRVTKYAILFSIFGCFNCRRFLHINTFCCQPF